MALVNESWYNTYDDTKPAAPTAEATSFGRKRESFGALLNIVYSDMGWQNRRGARCKEAWEKRETESVVFQW